MFTSEEEARRNLLLDRLYSSNIIFIPDEEYSQDIDSVDTEELREIALELSNIQRSAIAREETTLEGTPIDELDFSVRTYNCLKRANINTIEELRRKSKEELMSIRNITTKSLQEIEEKLQGLGLVIQTEEKLPELDDPVIQNIDNSEGTHSSVETELEKVRAIRDKLAREVQKLKQQTKSAEKLLASYDKLLGITPNSDKTQDPEGE